MRIGKSVWHAKRTSERNAKIAKYSQPCEIVTRPNYLTVTQATNRGYLEVLKYGENAQNTWTMIANGSFFEDYFNAGDVMWVDGARPNSTIEERYGYGASANAVIKNVAEGNLSISITLERNQNQVLL